MATEEKTTQPFENLINPYTNKPVQTGKGVSFNQKIYDTPNYMQQKNDLLDSFNAGVRGQMSVNEQAIHNIPVVPEFMQDEYNQAYQAASWLNSLNIATPDEIDEWRAKGKMGIGETAQRLKSLKSAKYVPFVGTTAEVGYNLDMLSAMNRLKKGEKVSQVEQDMLVDYLRELKEIQVRGTTLPSKALSAILESIPYFVEFGVGVAAAPETFGAGLSVSALALSKAAGKKAARKAVSNALKKAATESVMTGSKKGLSLSAAKQLYKSTYDDMLKAGATKAAKEVGAKETAKIVAKTTPQSIIAANFGSKPLTYMTAKNTIGGFADRQLAGGMQVTDAGELVFLEPENMALSIMKSFGSSIFDNYTETMGWAFAPVTSYFAKPVRNVLPKKFFTEFEKLVSSRYGMPAAQALKKYGYDGVVEEMGEELLNRFLCDVFGIEGLEGYTIDGFMNNVFYANDPEQWLVEALSFAAMGGAAHGTHGAYTKIREELEKQGNQKAIERLTELANKRIYSPAEFYLEQGLIKIDGSQSAAEQELRKKFEERGIDESTAKQFFDNASELEIREQLRKYYEEDGQDAEKRREKAVDFLTNRMLENKSYKNRDLAEKNANLFVTALEKFSETNGVAIEDLIREEAPTIRNQSEIEGAIREAAPEASQNRLIENRLKELEQEFSNIDETWSAEKFEALEQEYNELAELKNQGEVYYQAAYHGSPYEIDNISTDYVGTGEGAQAHGWGAYVAKNIDTGWEYRNRLNRNKDNDEAKVNGKELSKIYDALENQANRTRDNKQAQKIYDKMALIEELMLNKSPEEIIDNFSNEDMGDVSEALDWFENEIVPNLKYSGSLLEVDVPEDKLLLDEDKTIKQREDGGEDLSVIKDALQEIVKDDEDGQLIDYSLLKEEEDEDGNPITHLWISNIIDENLTGKEIYGSISLAMRDAYGIEKGEADKLTSQLLDKYGIKGIKYDGEVDGECCVIFNGDNIKTLNKYYQFAGEGSETADKYSLLNARKMLADGQDAEYVRKTTGWFKGVDGKFRYEISDNDATVNVDNIKKARKEEIDWVNLNIKDYNTRMSDLVNRHDAKKISDADFREQYDSLMNRKLEEVDALKYYETKGYAARLYEILDHEKLYAAYPSLRTVRVEFRPHSYGRLGTYSDAQNEISLDLTLLYGKESELKEVLMHEVQHYIQHKEKFAVGGNPQAVEIILADAKNAIKNSKDNKDYDFVMKKYSIVNNLLLIRSIQNKPENITKSYWWMQQGKGWYAPRKTRKKDRAKYINECCQEFIDYSIAKHKENNTFEAYKNYSQKDTAELKKEARRLTYRAGKILDKLSPDYRNLGRIESALKRLEQFELNTFDLYQRLAGETEARNTANRTNLSDKERLEKSPSETSDIPEAEQLVVFDDGTMAHAESDMSDDAIQGNMLFDNAKARELRKVKGSYMPAENLIELFKNADESTVVHEFAHWWLDRLIKYSENNEELAADVEAIRKFVKNDGEEFTREQHEKFARGFEAYIRSGYAKNNRLKRIFEDFKNALLAIYDSIKQLGYKDDDMPQIQNLFDRLLTSEKERIRATVFDKIAEIDAKIESIKENEAKEFADLDSIYKENIAYLDRQSQKKRSVQEYLELAETIPFRETKETREFKKRYKDATFEILEVATGYKRQFIANPRNWEKVQAAFEATDRITATDGMHPEWREFYPDTGVSYDNDEVDGDNKLAQMAFDVMTEGSYNRTLADNYEFEEIDRFYTKFDYLNNKVKTLKGTEKRAAYEALLSLFNDLPAMPDEIIVEIFDKMNSAEDEYEHQQREDFNRMIIPSIPVMHQLQFYITRKLDALKIYNPETRYKMKLNRSHRLYRYIKDINSVNAAKKQIRRINEFVIDDMRNNQRMLLHKEIQKQIKVNSKVVKVGTLTKGKFDWKTNTVFAELVEMNKMKREDAEKELGNIVQIQDAEKGENRDSYDENETAEFNKPNDFQDNLRKKFLQYRSMRLQDLDVTHTIQLLQDILELKEKGRQAKSEEDFINKTQRWNTRNNLLDVLEITKQSGAAFGAKWIAGVGKGVSLNAGTLANWESLLNALFNKDTAQKYSLLQDEAKSEVYARKHMLNFYKKASEIYGFNQANAWDRFLDYDYMQPLIKLMQEYNEEKYTYTQQVFSINSPEGYARSQIEISRAQMITMFAWSLNEQLEQRLFTQFGLQQIREMFEERLSEQDKQLAWALVDTCESMREDINDVFIRTTGLSLPAVTNYFPSKAERVQSDIDMYHDNFVKSSNPSFIKQRKTCNRIPMKPLAPLEILIPHINKTAKYVVMSEHVNFLNQIFKDTAIKTKMQEIWGSKDGADIYQTLINKLAACTFTNYSKGTNLVAGALDTLSRNYITSSIGFSPKVAIGQLLSVINYAENMPSSEWVKGFAETLKHPVENFKYMMENCEYLQTRLAGNSQNEVISILTSEKDKFRTLRNFMTSNVKWGDIIAITLGGKAYVDWLMKQGMTKEAAFDKFVEDTLRAQQAGTTSSISEWQSAQAKNCLTRMFFAFRNTDIQYERKFIDTLIQLKRGDIPKKEGIKKLFIYKIFNPFMFTSFLQNLSIVALIRGAFAGDDPDDVVGGFLKSAVEAVMLGGMTAYGFAGFIASSFMESLIALYDKEYKHFETDVPVMGDFDRQIQKYLKGDLSVADYVDAAAMGTELAFGLPASKVVNSAEGLGDIAQGNVGVGLSRLAGWGRYTSTKAWTGKEPEKKRKKKRKK